MPDQPFDIHDEDGYDVDVVREDGQASRGRVPGSINPDEVILSSDDVDDKNSPLPEESGSQYVVADLVDGADLQEAGTCACAAKGSAGVRAGEEYVVGETARHNEGHTDSPELAPARVSGGDTVTRPQHIVEITGLTCYNQEIVNGRQEGVDVTFSALRADGQEVYVNNKEMRDRHPLLLIDFYEQRIRFSSSEDTASTQ